MGRALVKQMKKLQELFAPLGKLLNTTAAVDLTESETAYHVALVKHVFAEHVVLQYNVTNTLKDQLLRNVTVEIGSDEGAPPWPSLRVALSVLDSGYEVVKVIRCPELPYDGTEQVYAVLRRPAAAEGVQLVRHSFYNHLQFDVHDVDAEGVPEDEGAFLPVRLRPILCDEPISVSCVLGSLL